MAPKTVSVHVPDILGRLGASSHPEAAAIARRDGIARACFRVPDGRQAVAAAVPSRGNGSAEKITSTGTSKYAAIRSAR
jgi:hypothetical protein